MTGSFNIWSIMFLAGIVQGIFLLPLCIGGEKRNSYAARLIGAILLLCVITNVDFFMIASGLYRKFPGLFGISFGMMFLCGPIVYLYARAILVSSFTFTKKHLLHFIPYALNCLIDIPFYLVGGEMKAAFINEFLAGKLAIPGFQIAVFSIQSIHLSTYLVLTLRLIRTYRTNKTSLLVPVEARLGWLNILTFCFAFFLVTVLAILVYVVRLGFYDAAADYAYTLVLSATIFIIGYTFVLNKEIVAPDFTRKYNSSQLPEEKIASLSAQLISLMELEKLYLDPKTSLASVAARMGIEPYILSQLLNESLGKNFFDFINRYRIEEVKKRLNDPAYEALSILGIALDVGFNSKSSFNTSFKKFTGMTPSEFKVRMASPSSLPGSAKIPG
jgi:AraC-like DNA-binding protein